MKKLLWSVLALGLLAGPALAANTWQVVDSSQCTGAGAATGIGTGRFDCCKGAASTNANTCDLKFSIGPMWARLVSMGTAGTSQTYTTGGDALNAAAIAKIGLSNIAWGECGLVNAPSNQAYIADVIPQIGGGAKIAITEMGPAVDTTAANGQFKEATSAQVMINTAVTCWFYGT